MAALLESRHQGILDFTEVLYSPGDVVEDVGRVPAGPKHQIAGLGQSRPGATHTFRPDSGLLLQLLVGPHLALVTVLCQVVAEGSHLHVQRIVLIWGFGQEAHL